MIENILKMILIKKMNCFFQIPFSPEAVKKHTNKKFLLNSIC